jgi:hypothetical protein
MCEPQVRFCERSGGAIPRAYSTASRPIVGLRGDDPAHTTPGARTLLLTPGNQMDMGVPHSLSRHQSVIEPNIESTRLELDHQVLQDPGHRLPDRSLLLGGQFKTGSPHGDGESPACYPR